MFTVFTSSLTWLLNQLQKITTNGQLQMRELEQEMLTFFFHSAGILVSQTAKAKMWA